MTEQEFWYIIKKSGMPYSNFYDILNCLSTFCETIADQNANTPLSEEYNKRAYIIYQELNMRGYYDDKEV